MQKPERQRFQLGHRAVCAVLVVIAAIAIDLSSCHNTDLHSVSPSYDFYSNYAYHDSFEPAFGFVSRFGETLHFVFAPRFSYSPILKGPVRLKPQLTPWGEAWNHDELSRNMDRILQQSGVDSDEARVRMIAHAIVSSGWRQNVWHYNAWGVKRGSWKGPWYRMPTVEMDDFGHETHIGDEEWRAFENWREAVDDYTRRITKKSRRPSYRKAARHLASPDYRSDVSFWKSLGEGNYYTTPKFSPGRFSALCFFIRQSLSET